MVLRHTRAVPSVAILIAGLALAQPAPAIRVADRFVVDVVFDAPPEGIARASRSDMLRAVTKGALDFSDLAPREAPTQRVSPCLRSGQPAPLLCLVRQLRPRFESARMATPAAEFDALWKTTQFSGEPPRADLALLIQYAPVLDRERVQALLLDLRAMAKRYTTWAATDRLTTQEQEALQDELFEVGVIRRRPVARDVTDARDVQAFMNDLFRTYFAEALAKRGYRNFGRIELRAPVGANLYVDGKAVGQTESELTRLLDIRAGPHALRIEHPEFLPHEEQMTIKAQRTESLSPTLVVAPNEAAVTTRQVLFWTGVATVAGGIAVMAATIATETEGGLCYNPDIVDCPSMTERPFSEIGGGVLGLPLGYSMVGAGAVWSLAALLNNDDQTYPWWEFLIGLAVAGASYGISVALNPEDPVEMVVSSTPQP